MVDVNMVDPKLSDSKFSQDLQMPIEVIFEVKPRKLWLIQA